MGGLSKATARAHALTGSRAHEYTSLRLSADPCLVRSSTERSLDPTLFRVHRTDVLDPSRLDGRAAGQVLQRPHCGCNTSQVQQGIRASELKWQKTCFLFLIMVEGIWRAY